MSDEATIIPTSKLKTVSVDRCVASPTLMREVDKESEEFIGICDSIRQEGFISAVTVRPAERGQKDYDYYVVDGLHRFLAAQTVGMTDIPVVIRNIDEAEALKVMLMGNIHKKDAKPFEEAKMIRAVLANEPTMTITDMGQSLGKNVIYIRKRLKLVAKITNPEIMKEVDSGKINLNNAIELSRLPAADQVAMLADAKTMSSQEFTANVESHLTEARKAANKGEKAAPKFEPHLILQTRKKLREEMESLTAGHALCADLKTPLEGYAVALKWIHSMDPLTLEERQAKWEEKQLQKEQDKQRRTMEASLRKTEKTRKELAEAEASAQTATDWLQKHSNEIAAAAVNS